MKDKTTTIFIIGDSTAANKDISGGKQERGWGMALQCFFDDHIVVDNHVDKIRTKFDEYGIRLINQFIGVAVIIGSVIMLLGTTTNLVRW